MCGIDQQDGSFAGRERTADFIAEIDMSGRVNQIEFIDFAVVCVITHADWMRLDGDAALLFKIHGVENLVMERTLFDGFRMEEKAVGQG